MELTPVLEPLTAAPTGVRTSMGRQVVDVLLDSMFGAVEFEAPTTTVGGMRKSANDYLRRIRPGYRLTIEAIGPITRITGRVRKWQAYIVTDMNHKETS